MNNADMPAMAQSMVLDQYENRIIVSDVDHTSMGLTKREHFAGLAMQGLLAGGYCIDDSQNRLNDVPSEAINLADALLKALEQDL